ncbi:MAG: restriction endonuclease subunit S [Acholeplasma sp.]|nr:restriction endonuclease subunit S [Acholeplasma sp.]
MNSPFNEAKYKALLEGLEISVLSFKEYSKENFEFRLDAEYFLKTNIRRLRLLSKIGYEKISSFAYVTDGIHTSIDYCDKSNVNLFSATTPRENYFDLSRQVFISEKAHILNPRTALKENDIIISTVGTIGNCAVVNKNVLPANSDRHVGIVRLKNNDFYPRYVSTFLLSKYGRFQTWRESTGNVQLNLFLYRIRTIKIAKLSIIFQKRIEKLILLNDSQRHKAQQIYTQAESLLLETLNLKDFEPSQEPVNIKNFAESFGKTGRLDAEYYQKKYEEIIDKVKSVNHEKLGSIVDITKSIEPGSDVYAETGVPFIRVSDYNKFGLSTPDKYLDDQFVGANEEQIKTLMPKNGDILFSKDGSVGTAYLLKEDGNFITSGAILHLKVKRDKEILPEYLTLALNSVLVQMQAERDAGGSIILHWRIDQIKNVVVPIIEINKQKEIAKAINESFRLKVQSEQLIEIAKKAVEIAIEECEDSAIDFINKNSNQDANNLY